MEMNVKYTELERNKSLQDQILTDKESELRLTTKKLKMSKQKEVNISAELNKLKKDVDETLK